jgi:hypothetical protein
VKQKPIIAQEIITGERGTDGHLLTIEGRPSDQTLEVQLALFNSVPNSPDQCIFVVTLCRLVALRAAWLIHQSARLPLTHPMCLKRMGYRTARTVRA